MTKEPTKLLERKYLLTFILITSLFALWGFANDITNPMVAAFQTVMEISATKAALVQFAFYGGYATMAIPAALFVRKYSYKSGILLGLALYAIGAFLFFPAAYFQEFGFFCVSLYVLTFGLAFLETTSNPFIMSLGSQETATRRLNLAQAFNPIGSLMGMFVASHVVLASLQSDAPEVREIGFSNLPEPVKASIRDHDLLEIRDPYVLLGCVVVVMFILIAVFVKSSNANVIKENKQSSAMDSIKRLWSNKEYREGVLTQVFYVGAQIMVWTFIIQYADNLGINKSVAQMYNILAMGMFLCGRFISTFLMKYVNSKKLLMIFAIGAMAACAGTILIEGMVGLYCLVTISIFMSLMFPTIYGIALSNVGEDTTLGAAFLVMAIVGGALLPLMQGMIIDMKQIGSLPAVNVSFILPFICFVVVAIYGYRRWQASKA